MKTLNTLFCLFGLGFGSLTFAASDTSFLEESGCAAKLEALARDYIKANEILVSIYEDQSGTGRTLDASTLKLCSSRDLDRGSWNLRRETGFCNSQGDQLVLFTYGNLWCDDETVLGIKSLTLAPAGS